MLNPTEQDIHHLSAKQDRNTRVLQLGQELLQNMLGSNFLAQ